MANALLDAVRDRYALDWHGIHGIGHWERVRDNGRRLAGETGAGRTHTSGTATADAMIVTDEPAEPARLPPCDARVTPGGPARVTLM